jgi:hypothetical protein
MFPNNGNLCSSIKEKKSCFITIHNKLKNGYVQWNPYLTFLWEEFNTEIIDLGPPKLNVKWEKTLNLRTKNVTSTVRVVCACMCVSLVFRIIVFSGLNNNNHFQNLLVNSITNLVSTY